MNRRVHVTFDAVAQRWEIADEGHGGRNELQFVADGISVGRNAAGVIMELVIDLDDTAGATSSARRLADDTFGAQVAALLDQPDLDDDFETVIELTTLAPVPSEPTSPAPSTPPSPVLRTASPIPGEPGIPVVLAAGRYTVPAGRTNLTLEVHADRLVVRAPRRATTAAPWAVIADAESGDVVALGPMESAGDGGTSAHLAFGLPIAPEQLFVGVTDDPLAPIEERRSRQRRWAVDLLDGAERDLRIRPRRARRAADQAAAIGEQLSDARISDRASRVRRRARRRLWWWLGGVALVAAATGAVVAASGGTDSTPSRSPSSTVYFENCDAARAGGPTPLDRNDPGYRPGLDRDGDGLACEG